jgi:hypothetical protein
MLRREILFETYAPSRGTQEHGGLAEAPEPASEATLRDQAAQANTTRSGLLTGEPPSRGYLALPKNKISSVSRIAPLSGSVAVATQI